MSIHTVPFHKTERCQYLILNYTYMYMYIVYTCLHHVSYNVVHVLYIHVYACICLGYHLHVHVQVNLVNQIYYVGAFTIRMYII